MKTIKMKRIGIFVCTGMCLLLTCCCKPSGPEYARPLPPGAKALRRLAPNQWPALDPVLVRPAPDLLSALDRSLQWYEKPSARQYFPVNDVSFEQARASAYAFSTLLRHQKNSKDGLKAIQNQFDFYESVGWDGQGTVLFTGYYAPIVKASPVKKGPYRYPLYRRPANLVSEPSTGKILGLRVGDQIRPYPSRRIIERSRMLAGHELAWLRDKFEAYLVHIQGSARLEMTDGSTIYVGYAGTNGQAYTSISKLLIADGKLDSNRLNLPAVKAYFDTHPEDLDRYVLQNDRYVFFTEFADSNWPAGSMGFPVTPMRSLATDKSIFPRGSVVLADTQIPTLSGIPESRFRQFMVDQDTGGAIRSPGRADIYMGIGPKAQHLAGRQLAEGKLYYLLLKPAYVNVWMNRANIQSAQAE